VSLFQTFLKIDLLLSIPQFFTYWLFCFSFLNPQPSKLYKRLFVMAIVHSVITDALLLILPTTLHLVNSILLGFILLFLLFRDIKTRQKILVIVFAILFGIAMDLILSTFLIYFAGILTREQMLMEKFPLVLLILYTQLIVTSIVSWLIRNRKNSPAKKFFSILSDVEVGSLLKVTSLIVFQFILLGVLQVIKIFNENYSYYLEVSLVYLLILVSSLTLVSIVRLLVRTREQATRSTQEVYIDDINDMFTSIRGQRHDFLNHVQVIHTMAQMGKTDQLKTYVADLVKETRDISEIMHHASPALAAFVQAKMTVALGKGIQFTYELPDKWDAKETTVKIIDIIKIMGNLVDNAFDEAMSFPAEERRVSATIRSMEDESIELEVSNRGRFLSVQEKQMIFKPGFTTKGDGHSGLGLAIVQERVKHYNGTLDLQSYESEGLTVFKVQLPQISA